MIIMSIKRALNALKDVILVTSGSYLMYTIMLSFGISSLFIIAGIGMYIIFYILEGGK